MSIILVMTLMVTFAQWKVYADEEKETTEIVENNLEVVYQEKEYKIIISFAFCTLWRSQMRFRAVALRSITAARF